MATGDAEQLAEERRLFYVAVTRARDALEINVPLRFHHHRHRLDDKHGYAPMSRFLTPEVQELMDVCHAGPPTGEILWDPAGAADGSGVAAVDAMLADLWA
jgi:DNA helicase-2/ATP-dependent DNA helicase PcrA